MAGYVRQSAADIVTGAVVLAAPINSEFNQLQAAFHATTGHLHDASSGNGPQITLTTSVTGILPPANGGVGAALTSTTDNTIPRFNGTAGIMQTSSAVITDAGGLVLTSTDAGAAAAPLLDLIRDSASPAASDVMGNIRFQGDDSGGNLTTYTDIFATLADPTNGSEDGTLTFRVAVAGTLTNRLVLNSSGLTLASLTISDDTRINGVSRIIGDATHSTSFLLFPSAATHTFSFYFTGSEEIVFGTGGVATFNGLITSEDRRVVTCWEEAVSSENDYPIGHMIFVQSNISYDINQSIALPIRANGAIFTTNGAVGTVLSGTWTSRGQSLISGSTYMYLAQRTA